MRAYETARAALDLRLTDHLRRLHDSARLSGMELPYTSSELRSRRMELVAANGLRECYLRPIAFYGYGELGVSPRGEPGRRRHRQLALGAYLGAGRAARTESAPRSRRGSASGRT
jgi:branched-chain amino acid aminotransferase